MKQGKERKQQTGFEMRYVYRTFLYWEFTWYNGLWFSQTEISVSKQLLRLTRTLCSSSLRQNLDTRILSNERSFPVVVSCKWITFQTDFNFSSSLIVRKDFYFEQVSERTKNKVYISINANGARLTKKRLWEYHATSLILAASLHCCRYSSPLLLICLDCVVSLGMASGKINDSQITASSTLSDEWLPKFARLNGNKAWCGKPSGKSDKDEYLQIDLGQVSIAMTSGSTLLTSTLLEIPLFRETGFHLLSRFGNHDEERETGNGNVLQ